jgi:FkbM family methyltransferase
MKNGTKIAEEFFYSYGSREYMNDHRNRDLLEKITKKSANLFVRGGDKISSNALVFGRHEIDTEELIKTYRNNGYHDFLLDIGANIGLTSCLIGNGFDRIFCYEPNPQVYRILQTNIEITFGIDHQVTLNNFGLGEENKQLELTIPKKNFGGAYIKHGNTYSNDILLNKDGITDPSNAYDHINVSIKNAKTHLEKLFHDGIPLESRGVIKIDVEGYEPYILRAIAETLPPNNSCAIIFENHDPNIKLNDLKGYFNRNISLYRLNHYPVRAPFKDKSLRRIRAFFGATGHYTLKKLDNEKDHTGQLLIVVEAVK